MSAAPTKISFVLGDLQNEMLRAVAYACAKGPDCLTLAGERTAFTNLDACLDEMRKRGLKVDELEEMRAHFARRFR